MEGENHFKTEPCHHKPGAINKPQQNISEACYYSLVETGEGRTPRLVDELSAVADQMALEMAIKIYSVFGWIPVEAAVRTLAEDQKKLIERRL